MMNACEHHANAIDTPERARETAEKMLGRDFNSAFCGITVNNPALMAQVITDMSRRQEACCARALYARFLMSIAYREALLPSGWYDLPEVSIEPVFGPRCLLDDGDLYGGSYVAWVLGDDDYNEWPSEDQLISWNEANDYLHEGDYE